MSTGGQPAVILIHGIASGSSTMWPLAWHLRRAGYQTRCYGYPSLRFDLGHHGRRFREFVESYRQENDIQTVHVVAHSMGGIVTRAALTPDCPEFIQRIVMLGTPQSGSPQATFLAKKGLRFIRTLAQLSHEPSSFVNELPPIDGPEIGALSASYDWVVPRHSSQFDWQSIHRRVFSGHNGLLVRPKVAKLVVRFLQTGQF